MTLAEAVKKWADETWYDRTYVNTYAEDTDFAMSFALFLKEQDFRIVKLRPFEQEAYAITEEL